MAILFSFVAISTIVLFQGPIVKVYRPLFCKRNLAEVEREGICLAGRGGAFLYFALF
jgi:hypothetical protein